MVYLYRVWRFYEKFIYLTQTKQVTKCIHRFCKANKGIITLFIPVMHLVFILPKNVSIMQLFILVLPSLI